MQKAILTGMFIFLSVLGHSKTIEVQGHRGTRGLKPENTLPSFASAIEAGVDALELDVLMTIDGSFVIHHNFFTNNKLCIHRDGKPLTKEALVSSLSVPEIKKLDCGTKVNPEFPKQQPVIGAEIPTLQELFYMIQNSTHPHAKNVRLNIEIKRDPRNPALTVSAPFLAKKLVEYVNKHGFASRVYYSSFDPEVLIEVRKCDPRAEMGFIFAQESLAAVNADNPKAALEMVMKLARRLNIKVLSPEHELVKDKQLVKKLQQAGFRVIPWTVNEHKRWHELVEMGVDGIISDYPHDLIQFLQNRKLR
jgi:glycerophosphoryl diester phosphodiesterase